jgi:putative nucleotidyltransferase with HDIG domain
MPSALLTPPPASARPSPASVRQYVLANLERIEDYPAFSATTVRAMAMVNNPEVPSAEVARLIYRDSVLTASVLRMANSWLYRGRKAVEDVQQAVLRIGLKECGKILCAVGIRGMNSKPLSPEVQKRCDALLKHSLFVAHVAAAMSRTVRRDYQGTDFTGGLLHDIGRLIACVRAPEVFPQADPIDLNEADAADLLQRERDHLGIDHCAIGYNFASKNNLPEPLVRIILNHHRPFEEQLQQELVALVAVADRIANYAQREHKVEGYNLDKCPYFPFLVQYWPKEQQAKLRKSVPIIIRSSSFRRSARRRRC